MHLVLPERPLFSRDKAEPSASIVLKVRGTLEAQQVRAIRHLVATAVNGLKPQRVSVVDETGRLLADGSADDSAGGVSADERKVAYERRMREQVESIVTSVVGPGHARVQLTADFDFNRITQTSDKFDPEGRVVRSSQTREEVIGERRRRPAARCRSATSCPAPTPARGAAAAARPEPQDRGNRQLRDFAHHQDRGDRGRPRQPHLGRGRGRRHLRQERQGRADLSAAQQGRDRPHRRAGAQRHRLRPASAATRSRSSTCASPRRPPIPISEPTGWMSYLQFTKDDIMHWVEVGVMALLGLLVLLLVRAAAGPPHHHARGARDRRRRRRAGTGRAGRRRRRRRRTGGGGVTASGRHEHHRRRPAAASPRPAGPTSRSSAATKRSRSPTAPRP